MAASPEDLFACLDRLGIATRTVRHPPLLTVEQSRALRGEIAGGIVDEYPRPAPVISVDLPLAEVERLLGIAVTQDDAAAILEGLEFSVERLSGEALRVNGYLPPEQFLAALDSALGKAVVARKTQVKPSSRPTAILIVSPRCQACEELERETLKRPEVQAELAKFDVVRRSEAKPAARS